LLRAAGAGDDHGDLMLIDDPSQGDLRRRHTFGNQGAQPIHRLQTHVERHPGERLADVDASPWQLKLW